MTEFIKGIDRIEILMEDFKDLDLNYTDFCEYYIHTGTLCPLMTEDLKQNENNTMTYHPHNFNVLICLHCCKHFKKINIPEKVELKYGDRND